MRKTALLQFSILRFDRRFFKGSTLFLCSFSPSSLPASWSRKHPAPSSFSTVTTQNPNHVNHQSHQYQQQIEQPAECQSDRQDIVKVYNALDQGCLPYDYTWAWQQVLLAQRLQYKRNNHAILLHHNTLQEPFSEDNKISDTTAGYTAADGAAAQDCILILEHQPVYTLGRGADETHLTFLKESQTIIQQSRLPSSQSQTINSPNIDIHNDIHHIQWKLSRHARGPGTARLSPLDRQSMDALLSKHQQEHSHDYSLYQQQCAIQLLRQLNVSPVYAPTNSVPIYRVDRGGQVTYHGPQQLVVYPMLDLSDSSSTSSSPQRRQQDLHWYLRTLETAVIQTLQEFGIPNATRHDVHTGVWVDQQKVAAIGISASHWITTHGVALNVNPSLEYFDTTHILPCGILMEGQENNNNSNNKGVTSMASILQEQYGEHATIPTMKQVANILLEQLQNVFQFSIIR